MAGPEHADLPPAGGASLGRSVRAFGRNQGANSHRTQPSSPGAAASAASQPRPQHHGGLNPPTADHAGVQHPPTADRAGVQQEGTR